MALFTSFILDFFNLLFLGEEKKQVNKQKNQNSID